MRFREDELDFRVRDKVDEKVVSIGAEKGPTKNDDDKKDKEGEEKKDDGKELQDKKKLMHKYPEMSKTLGPFKLTV